MLNERNVTTLMDFYELTMANGYFKNGTKDKVAVFDVFYRNNPDEAGYALFSGLDDIINYIINFHFDEEDIKYLKSLKVFDDSFLEYLKNFKFRGDVYSFKNGSVIYPNEPIITVVAPLMDAQLLETGILVYFNHESLISTKANRIVLSARGRSISDFGARRAHNVDSALCGAKASYIGGVDATATLMAGEEFKIPVTGTMAHSWVMSFDSEYEAFLSYAKLYPSNVILLIDTYDVLKSGIKNAIKVNQDYLIPNGYRLKAVRIDSGDLAYLSKKCREELDLAGMKDCKISVTNSLDEYKISSLLDQGAPVDFFGVGENLITSKSNPVFGGVYKLVGIEDNGIIIPKIKVSASIEKVTNPGFKDVYRVYDENNKSVADLITIHGEKIDTRTPYNFVDPNKPWKKLSFINCKFKNLREKIIENGKLIIEVEDIKTSRAFVRNQVDKELWDEEKRFVMPHIHYVDFSKAYYDLKLNLLSENKFE